MNYMEISVFVLLALLYAVLIHRRTFEREITSVHNKRIAPAGKVFIVVRAYSLKINKVTRKRDRYMANVLCDKVDVDTPEKIKVISEHIFKQIKEKYKLEY